VAKFRTIFLEDVLEFFDVLSEKEREKILFNIDKAEKTNDPRLFKKLTSEIWEFRTKYGNLQYRLFAFWDKWNNQNTLVVCTHGMVKKTDKVPSKEIEKSERLRKEYFENQ
jgi:phage-related protein